MRFPSVRQFKPVVLILAQNYSHSNAISFTVLYGCGGYRENPDNRSARRFALPSRSRENAGAGRFLITDGRVFARERFFLASRNLFDERAATRRGRFVRSLAYLIVDGHANLRDATAQSPDMRLHRRQGRHLPLLTAIR